jgi:hypothetical protein
MWADYQNPQSPACARRNMRRLESNSHPKN